MQLRALQSHHEFIPLPRLLRSLRSLAILALTAHPVQFAGQVAGVTRTRLTILLAANKDECADDEKEQELYGDNPNVDDR